MFNNIKLVINGKDFGNFDTVTKALDEVHNQIENHDLETFDAQGPMFINIYKEQNNV